jgi:hypothetical protein
MREQELDTLLTALYVLVENFVVPTRSRRGRSPLFTDSELLTVAVAQVLLRRLLDAPGWSTISTGNRLYVSIWTVISSLSCSTTSTTTSSVPPKMFNCEPLPEHAHLGIARRSALTEITTERTCQA